jgi:simple sugar transport system permease protein
MIVGGALFALMGKPPVEAIRTIFWDPLFGEFRSYTLPQLLVKAGPLILIATGLSFGFRAGIWNIGAEGQYVVGALCGAAVGLAFYPAESRLIFPSWCWPARWAGSSGP